VLVLSHVKELVEQSSETLTRWFPRLDVGVYSAGVGKRDTKNAVIAASIQSVYSKAFELCGDRPFNLVIVDEAHRIPLSGDGMYRTLFDQLAIANPSFRVIGLTATNYRTNGGYVTGKDYLLNDVCYEAGVRHLIADGYLSKLVSKRASEAADLSAVKVVRGEFDSGLMEDAFEEIVESAVDELLRQSTDRRSVLLFCAGVDHMNSVVERIRSRGHECYGITGQTSKSDREELIGYFKSGELKYLANVNVLTEGFDAPNVDMVALLRATISPGLYYQMVGRGLRICDGKINCKVLDFGGNVERHGPIDAMVINDKKPGDGGEPPAKACPNCDSVMPIQTAICHDCGYEFPEPEEKERHGAEASKAAILSEDIEATEFDVSYVTYAVHRKRNAPDDAPRTMRVTYWGDGDLPVADEWVCVEHEGWARSRAEKWWKERSQMLMGADAEKCVKIANAGGLAVAKMVATLPQPGTRFTRIVRWELGDVPEPVEVSDEWDEVPF
jgi:DNA repair protein RadD